MTEPFYWAYLGPYRVQVWSDTPEDKGFVAIDVPSSTNRLETYTVIREHNGNLACECKSFYYRQSCRHVSEVAEFLKQATAS